MTDTMLTHDGITQPITEWALDYGIYPGVIADRLTRGWTAERAITTPMAVVKNQQLDGDHLPGLPRCPTRRFAYSLVAPRPARQGRLLSHNGQTMTIPQWANHLGLTPVLIYKRLNSGWPVEWALSQHRHRRCPGVVKNLPALPGTGGGSVAQEIS